MTIGEIATSPDSLEIPAFEDECSRRENNANVDQRIKNGDDDAGNAKRLPVSCQSNVAVVCEVWEKAIGSGKNPAGSGAIH